ncbi:MAG: bifunctional UDP-N-acetylglucosamine diphosphorylase/glucosamine-1-phosphate N-acetyltransferase GlmU [Clostridiaceae bacterium]|nr:bifunctional UDP-N-acetylglucosamine diphosphorylase/glucosamine-1-phosphate N-acetyltransferase GlmU [Clostridiaceae bacterium]
MVSKSAAIILAAGDSYRMKSALPYVMTRLLSKPMLEWVITAVKRSGVGEIAVISASDDNAVADFVRGSCDIYVQPDPHGTAHATMQARPFIERNSDKNILILNGDSPLMDAETIRNALGVQIMNGYDCTIISAKVEKPFGYGRIVRDSEGNFVEIVEEKDAASHIKKIDEISSGAYWFNAGWLLKALDAIDPRKTGEYNLVDAISWMVQNGCTVGTSFAARPEIVLGANDRNQLHELNHIARRSLIEKHLEAGVDIPSFESILIGPDVEIGMDTLILPGTIIRGKVKIGKNCQIGPNTLIENSIIGDEVTLNTVQCYNSTVKKGATIGPFVHIRPNSVIGENVHLGNFVEVKNSVIDTGTKVSHLTYVGDSDVGKHVNFGCGTVTVNYNGKQKYRTKIMDNAFIGCNTNLVAPVTVGEGAYTAAGSTITEDVPDAALGIARARQVNKIGWKLEKVTEDEQII